MDKNVVADIKEVTGAVHYRPAVSVIMPFEPKMGLKAEITHGLKLALDKVEKELEESYPDELGSLVMQKLRNIAAHLNFNTHKKSIAIYVSPVFEKVLYLDIAVEEKIIVDESFEIRDLVYCKQQAHKYLLLQLSAERSRMYVANGGSLMLIVSNTPAAADAYRNDVAERVANFSDPKERKEVLLDKFLHHVDNALDIILHAYRLPLFVLGAERVLGHFKKLTKHGSAVVEYVHGNYEEASETMLRAVLEPHIADWKKVVQKDLLNRFEEAANKNRLAVGINNVWREAVQHKGRLLVVEKNYMYPALRGSKETSIYPAGQTFGKFSYIKDAVDDVIEKVLEDGGDVEFVDEGVLQDYQQIVLVQYY